MFEILILICSTAIPPGSCRTDTADQVYVGPAVRGEIACGFAGQALVAGLPTGQMRPDQVMKILCRPTHR
jgi:hypothetical protein